MISLEVIEEALQYLGESAPDYAKAVGRRTFLEEKRKSVKALLYNQSERKSVADRENDAYAHADYLKLLDELRDSVEMEVLYRSLRAAYEAQIDCWRTQESSRRAANIV